MIRQHVFCRNLRLTAVPAMLLCLVHGCKKSDPGISNEPVPLIKTMTDAEADYAYRALYTYDAQQRVTTIDDNGTLIEYQYAPGKITRTARQGPGNTTVFEYELNEKGLIKSQHIVGEATRYFYEYNAEGFLVKYHDDQTPQYSSTYHYNPQTGLLDSITATLGGAWHNTHVYSYYTDKTNTLGAANEGKPYFGKDGLHPIKKQVSRYKDGNTIKTQVYDYTYTFDDTGRVRSKAYTEVGLPYLYFYTYYE